VDACSVGPWVRGSVDPWASVLDLLLLGRVDARAERPRDRAEIQALRRTFEPGPLAAEEAFLRGPWPHIISKCSTSLL